MKYSIIIPVYNEISNISKLLSELYHFHLNGHQILIIDDGSVDGTSQVLLGCKFIELITLKTNQGKGVAVREGLKNAQSNKIIIFDSDLEIHPSEIGKMMILDQKQNLRCVFGSRYSNFNSSMSIWDFGNIIITKLFNFIYNTKLSDSLCCAKAFFLKDLNIDKLRSSSFDIDIEITKQLVKKNNVYLNIELIYKRRSFNDGKKLRINDSFAIVKRILKN